MTAQKILEECQAAHADAVRLVDASLLMVRTVDKLLEAVKRFNLQCERLDEFNKQQEQAKRQHREDGR
jgi:hypothetical protein